MYKEVVVVLLIRLALLDKAVQAVAEMAIQTEQPTQVVAVVQIPLVPQQALAVQALLFCVF
jgi:hypothetical protein